MTKRKAQKNKPADSIPFNWDEAFNFHWKFGDFEICTCREQYSNKEYRFDNDSPIRKDIPVELVKWENWTDEDGKDHRTCFVLAWWRKTKEDIYELKFCGGRPFDHIEPQEIAMIWKQLQAAQHMLDLYTDATREE